MSARISKATWQSNYGSDSAHEDNLHYYSSRGPREDGGFKPQIVAPGSAISTVPTWQAGGPVAGTYDLPAGYAMFNGTSMASPQAAGAAALLVSAALQAGAQHQPDQLRQAMLSSARLLDTNLIQVYEQGNGLIDVGAAWDLLKTNIKTVAISSSVPVDTVLSRFLADAGMGQGIFIREGLSVDDEVETRQYTFTRTSGGSKAITYNLSWGGNDGTFRATFADTQGQQLPTDSISLPLNKPVRINVDIVPTTPGVHSAILNLDDPATAGIDYQTMNVVVAADQFTAENSYTVTKSGIVERNQMLSFFFNVPAGTPAFNVAFSGPSGTAGTGQARFLRFHPYGVGIDSNSSLSCYNPSVSGCGTGNPDSRTASNPQAGVWEVTVDARRTSDTAEVPFKLTASILGASVEPNPDVIESATIGTPVARSYTVTNLFGAFNGGAVGTALGSAYQETPTIEHHEVQEFFVDVTEGSTSLRATIGGTSDKAADLDLFIYDCTAGADKCIFRGQSADGDSEESVTINTNVKAGQWKVVVDGYAVPAGSTTFNYLDVFANPAFGSVSITDAGSLRPAGSSWTVPGAVTANAAPAEGRVLLGSVEVRTDGDILVGSGDVVIQNVSR